MDGFQRDLQGSEEVEDRPDQDGATSGGHPPLWADLCAECNASTVDGRTYFFGPESWQALGQKIGQELPPLDRTAAAERKRDTIHAKVGGRGQVKGFYYKPASHVGELSIKLRPNQYPLRRFGSIANSLLYDLVRVTATPDGKHLLDTWVRGRNAQFVKAKPQMAEKMVATYLGPDDPKPAQLIGEAAKDPWPLCDDHFKPEWDESKRVYHTGVELAATPRKGEHPLTTEMFERIGSYLTPYARRNDWCVENQVDGPAWLWFWVAIMVQDPHQALPLLFLWSLMEDSCGKSTWIDLLTWLFKDQRGAVDAYAVLTDRFNLPFYGAVLGYIDEKKLDFETWLKVKELITASHISIRAVARDMFKAKRSLHLALATNEEDALPLKGRHKESRVQFIEVPPISPERRDKFNSENQEAALKAEIPHVLYTLLHVIQLPPKKGRLYLPVLDTPLRRKVLGLPEMAEADDPPPAGPDAANAQDVLKKHFRLDAGGCMPAAQFTKRWKEVTKQPLKQRDLKSLLKGCASVEYAQRTIDGKRQWVVLGVGDSE